MKTITDQNFIDFMDEYFGYGYGSGEEYWFPALKTFFYSLKDERSYDHEILTAKLGGLGAWLLINDLCKADILDYGTSPRWGWLSEKGELLRDYLKDKTVDYIIEIHNKIDSECGRTYCNCDPKNEGGCKNNPLF